MIDVSGRVREVGRPDVRMTGPLLLRIISGATVRVGPRCWPRYIRSDDVGASEGALGLGPTERKEKPLLDPSYGPSRSKAPVIHDSAFVA